MKKYFVQFLKWPVKKVFLADAIGAFFTSSTLGLVLIHFHQEFGLPVEIFNGLSILVVPYFVYSATVYLSNPVKWQRFMKIIAAANAFYCAVTFTMVFVYLQNMTVLGLVYFIGEALLILTIAAIEWIYATVPRNKNV